MNSENIFPKIISYLFHPLLLPLAGLLLIFNVDEMQLWMPPSETKIFLYALTFLATFLLPLLNAILLLRMKIISSLEMKTKEERKIPYFAAVIFYFTEFYLLKKADMPQLLLAVMAGVTLLAVIVLLINLFWKISAHMAGIGGLIGILLVISFSRQINLQLILIVLFFIAGLIGFSRLKLSAHNPAQVYLGFLIGVFSQLVLFLT